MEPKIAVLGAGAVGAPVAGQLAARGHDVTLIDPWVEHVEQVRNHGLRITTGPWENPDHRETVELTALHLFELAAVQPTFDMVFLTSKSYDSAWLVQLIAPYLADDGSVVCMQNSMNDEWVAPIVGRGRDVACILTAGGGELVAPGDVWRDHARNAFMLGELDGSTSPRIDGLCEVLNDTAVTTSAPDIWGGKWTKLAQTAMAGAFAGLTGGRTREILPHELATSIAHEVGMEVVRVGAALGQDIAALRPDMDIDKARTFPEVLLPTVDSVKAPGREAHNFIYQDLLKGRKTEIDFVNGLVCQKGRETGVPTPVNQQAVDLVHQAERGELKPSMDNLALITL